MTIYIASKTSHAERWKALRASGHRIIATWIDEAGEGQTSNISELAQRCIREAVDADVTILFCERGETLKGALIEAGAALAAGREVRCVGTCNNLSRVFSAHPLWTEWPTIEDALACKGNKP